MVLWGATGGSIGGKYSLIAIIAILTLALSIYTVIHVYEPVVYFIAKYLNRTLFTVLVIVIFNLAIILPVIYLLFWLNTKLAVLEAHRNIDTAFGMLLLAPLGLFVGMLVEDTLYIVISTIAPILIIILTAVFRQKTHASGYKRTTQKRY